MPTSYESECSPVQWQHRRLDQNNIWSPIRVSTVTHPLKHIHGENHVCREGMCELLDDHEGSVSIERRCITSFRFAYGIVVNAKEEEEANVLIQPPQCTKGITNLTWSDRCPLWRLVQNVLTHMSLVMKKTCLRGFRPGKTQTGLLSYRNKLES